MSSKRQVVYNMVIAGDLWSSTQVVKHKGVCVCKIIIIKTKPKFELKSDESKYGKTNGTTQITTS